MHCLSLCDYDGVLPVMALISILDIMKPVGSKQIDLTDNMIGCDIKAK
jgi:hypothetical protein